MRARFVLLIFTGLFLGLSFFSPPLYAVDPRLNWHTSETDHFYIHYADDYKKIAQQAAAYAELAHQKISQKLAWKPREKTHLVISDESDNANGFAEPVPFNRSVIFISAPDEANSLEDTHNWLQTLITHEYTHIIHLDRAAGGVDIGRSILGRNFYLFPNIFQPSWMIEGLATYYETDKLQGIGRGQNSFFRMMMRMEVEQGIKPVNQVNLPLRSWPLGTSYYLYGVYFYQFLKDVYGAEAVEDLVINYSDNLLPFFINNNAEDVLDKDLTQLWREFELWLQKDFSTETKQIKENITSGKKITNDGYFRTQIRSLNDGRYYYIRSNAYQHTALIESSANHEVLSVTDINPGARIDVHPEQGVLISQPEFCDEYNRYYDLFILKPHHKKIQRLTHCGRYVSAAWTRDGKNIIAVHLNQSKHELLRLDAQAKLIEILWKADNNQVLGQPDVSPDDVNIAVSIFREGRGWNIEEFNLISKKWQPITQDAAIDMYAQYAPDGRSILFSSDRDAVFNIYQWHKNTQQLEQLTQLKGGAFKPVFNGDKSQLFYESYSAQGYDVSVLSMSQLSHEKLEIKKQENVYTSQKAPALLFDRQNISHYSPWSSLRPRWWLPVIRTNNEQSEIGFQTSGNDALGVHNYFMELSLSNIDADALKSERVSGFFSYRYADRFVLGVQRRESILRNNSASLFNGEQVAVATRVEDELFAALLYTWPGVESSWRLSGGMKLSRDSVGASLEGIDIESFADYLSGASLRYWDFKQYARSISVSDGADLRLNIESNNLGNSFFSGEVYSWDARYFVRLGLQQVLALRWVQAWGTDFPEPFRLGGEGRSLNPLSIFSPVAGDGASFGQRSFPLRGYATGIAELQGRRMQLLTAEWRFPLGGLIERGWMAPPVGLIQSSARLFIDSGAAWNQGSQTGKYFTGIGAEFLAEVNWFYGATVNWRLGFAKGLDENLGEEFIYLNLGGSF